MDYSYYRIMIPLSSVLLCGTIIIGIRNWSQQAKLLSMVSLLLMSASGIQLSDLLLRRMLGIRFF